MKTKHIYFSLLIFIITSCTKNKNFDFPTGTFVLKDFTAVYNDKSVLYLGWFSSIYIHLIDHCEFQFDGKNKIYFYSQKGTECFKIKKINLINDSINYAPKLYKTNSFYKILLKNKKGKNFEFNYGIINDSILIGEFWEKGQNYFRSDSPNMIKENNQTSQVLNGFEILGVYHLKK